MLNLQLGGSLLGGGFGGVPLVGGLPIGYQGDSGIYDGYTLAWGDDFNSLDIISPQNSRGKWFTTRTYAAGARGSDTILAPLYDTDPHHLGYNDYGRGVPIGYDNMYATSSVLTLQARYAEAGERLAFQGTGRYALGSMICSSGAFHFYPGAADGDEIILEARMKYTETNPAGWHPTLWTIASEPVSGVGNPTSDEHDFEGDDDTANLRRNLWGGLPGSGSSEAEHFTYDGVFHTWALVLSKSVTEGVRLYKDGVLFSTGAYNANLADKVSRFLITSHVDTSGTEAGWLADADGATMDLEWVRAWHRNANAHYVPLVSQADVNMDKGGTTDIVLPSLTALWGDATVTDYIQAVMTEENEPGNDHATGFGQFPAGVTYNSGTRTLTVAPTSDKAGRLNFVVLAKKEGCTCAPMRFSVNVGPVINAGAIEYTVGASGSYDLYAQCDCGVLVTNGTTKTKTITVTGLPVWATYSDTTGLITWDSAVDTGTSNLTVGVTNSIGQTKSSTSVTLQKASSAVTSFSDDFTGTNGDPLEGRTGWSLLSGTAGALQINGNELRGTDTSSTGTMCLAPELTSSDHYVEAKFTSASSVPALAMRVTDVNNFIYIRRSSGTIEVFKRISGAFTKLADYTPGGLTSSDVCRVAVSGSTLTFTMNGTPYSPSSGSATITGGPPATPRVGVIGRSANATGIDDFACGV